MDVEAGGKPPDGLTMRDVFVKMAAHDRDAFVTFPAQLVVDKWDALAAKTAIALFDEAPADMTAGDLLNTITTLQFWVVLLLGIGTTEQIRKTMKTAKEGGDNGR